MAEISESGLESKSTADAHLRLTAQYVVRTLISSISTTDFTRRASNIIVEATSASTFIRERVAAGFAHRHGTGPAAAATSVGAA